MLTQCVADVAVTVNASGEFAGGPADRKFVHEVGMTVNACSLRHAAIAGFDLNRIMVILECERQRMEETVVSLGDPFADRMVR